MHIRFSFLLVAVVVLLIPAAHALGALPAPPSSAFTASASTCKTIDDNWKKHGRKILGANTIISDVVLNACEGIGGEQFCRFTSGFRGGSGGSQHRLSTAIDLRVSSGKEKEFITLAICGLRRVNNCQGGIGMYKSRALHVDMRKGVTNAWGQNRSRTSITPQNISDPQTRSILKAFDADKCTGGVTGDYSETDRYGQPVQYTPPQSLPRHLWPQQTSGGQGSTPQDLQQALSQSPGGGSGSSGGGQVLGSADAFKETTPSLLSDDVTGGEKDNELSSFDENSSSKELEPINPDAEKQSCENTGLFGTNLFNTCKTDEEDVFDFASDGFQEDVTDNGFERHLVGSLVGDTPQVRINDGYDYDGESTSDGFGSNIFYGFHDPTDDVSSRGYGTFNDGGGVVGATQFVATQVQDAMTQGTPLVPRVFPAAARTVGIASYRTMLANIPFTVPGGVAALLLPFAGSNYANVNNLFSI